MTAERFFDAHQRATIEAAMARIIPTDDLPGAREAGSIDFLDRYLAGIGSIYARPDGSGFEVLAGKRAEAWQRRIDAIRARYVAGVVTLDRLSRASFGSEFALLETSQQDRILTEVERSEGGSTGSGEGQDGDAPPLQQTKAEIDLGFFGLLCLHTRQGFYADPIYGGNRDRVGWQTIGFPGPTSLAEVHSGRYSTLAWFAESQPEHDAGAGDEA
ncbi:MAG: gluconate 2-dehydrogenase gamma chain [Chloroflexota bacterium]|jgi:gluconate 2-dehydrogenase gamma chain|nr:gluconate 2-dehydrogenase gamma chain [Chloroflexota bacterium]